MRESRRRLRCASLGISRNSILRRYQIVEKDDVALGLEKVASRELEQTSKLASMKERQRNGQR